MLIPKDCKSRLRPNVGYEISHSVMASLPYFLRDSISPTFGVVNDDFYTSLSTFYTFIHLASSNYFTVRSFHDKIGIPRTGFFNNKRIRCCITSNEGTPDFSTA